MKCDERGNIWVTGPDGVWVFASDGEHLGVVEIPGERRKRPLGRTRLDVDVRAGVDVALPVPDEGRGPARAVHALSPGGYTLFPWIRAGNDYRRPGPGGHLRSTGSFPRLSHRTGRVSGLEVTFCSAYPVYSGSIPGY